MSDKIVCTGKKEKALIFALIPFGIGMLIIGLFFGVGYWTADSPAARWLLFVAGLGGSGYIFMTAYRALRHR